MKVILSCEFAGYPLKAQVLEHLQACLLYTSRCV